MDQRRSRTVTNGGSGRLAAAARREDLTVQWLLRSISQRQLDGRKRDPETYLLNLINCPTAGSCSPASNGDHHK